MGILEATAAYERWLASRLPLVRPDLRAKHEAMAEGVFPFLRATFYRWAQVWPDVCRELAGAPRVLAVGDLHVENFGTWRDAEGRLIWGVNDFDEACPQPYTNDLVRLAASAILAVREDHLGCDPHAACDAVLDGYSGALAEGGEPFVLAEHHRWLRRLVEGNLRDPTRFWTKLTGLPTVRGPVPSSVRRALTDDLPEGGLGGRIVHRRAGLGSLGRRRFMLLSPWGASFIAREAKELTESAWSMLASEPEVGGIGYETISARAVRVVDPFVRLSCTWIVRRLSPDCSRIELRDLPRERDELRLLQAMGRETANLHLGSPRARKGVLRDLARRHPGWLRAGAVSMAESTVQDWKDWRRRPRM
jgi:hypothetical protein